MSKDFFLLTAESIAGEVGEALLRRLVEALSQNLSAKLVLITLGEGGVPPTRTRAIYALHDGVARDDISYTLEGTPCYKVYHGEDLIVPCKLGDLFPREAGLEGYIGLPLRNADDQVIGHLAVFSDTPVEDADVAMAVMRVFGHRVEAELRRRAYDAERRRLIDELNDLNQRLRVSYLRARAQNRFNSQLIGMIAHDLRSPLTAIMAHADLVQKQVALPDVDAGRVAARCDRITAIATRMADQMEAALQRVRDGDEGLRPDLRPVDLSTLARIALEANQPEADRKAIGVTLVDEGPAQCPGDAGLLVPAIDNLLSNAIKYTQSGGRVTVTVRPADDHCEVAVSDNGQGMTEGDLARVFGRFQTLSARPTGGETSTGLGLSNVREIMAAHAGTATAESAGPGMGSTFRLTLPLSAPCADVNAPSP